MTHLSPVFPVDSRLDRVRFTVAPNAHGQWVARERRGLIEGVFLTQREAIRFALSETGHRSTGVVVTDASSPDKH